MSASAVSRPRSWSATRSPEPARGPAPDPAIAIDRTRGTLGGEFDAHANSLGLLRLLLAATVAIAHAGAVGYGTQPLLGATEIGSMAVDAFFVLSGFLVTRSMVRLGSVGRYTRHRFLRIMPGFWVCLLVTAFGVAPLLAALEGGAPGDAFAGPDSSLGYVTSNAALFMRDFSVGALPTGTHQPGVVNGALWTLFYEATCYVAVAVAALAGLLTRHRGVTVALTAVAAVPVVVGEVTGAQPPGDLFWRFFLVFGLGALGFLFADTIPLRRGLLALALGWIAGSVAVADQYLAWAAVPFAYVCLYAVVRTPWLRRGPKADLSYGLYVYHWPVETVLVTAGATALTPVGYTVLALVLALLAAAASWYVIEKPALSLKHLGRH